jgi:hypothetical protein
MSEVIKLFSSLVEQGHIQRETLLGCTGDEILTIENHFNAHLPEAYRDFLSIAGKGAGKLFRGTDIFYPRVMELQSEAQDLLNELELPSLLPPDAIVFCMHQGYEINFFAPMHDDPPVSQYVEGDAEASVPWQSFSEFISTSIQSHIMHWSDLN